MKEIQFSHPIPSAAKIIFSLSLLLAAAAGMRAQTGSAAEADSPARRMARARALSAVSNLPAARSELESLLREPGADGSIREIALVLLVGVYLDQADYTYAENTLNEAFRKRTAQDEAATRAYFAVAGQVINGVRAHVERYRAFGLNINDNDLPTEAVSDLERVRTLLERVVTQGKALQGENSKGMESSALLEEAASLRTRLARNDGERAQWQREVADARQHIMGPDRRVAGSGNVNAAANAHAPTPLAIPPAQAPAAVAPAQPRPSPTPTPVASSNTPQTAAAPPATSSPNNNNPANNSSATNRPPAPAGPTQAVPTQPVNVGSLLSRATQKVDPTYPPAARAARAAGQVTVYLQLDEKGGVAAVQRTDGPQLLRRAAEDAARRWKFRPMVIEGQPVPVAGYLSFRFTL